MNVISEYEEGVNALLKVIITSQVMGLASVIKLPSHQSTSDFSSITIRTWRLLGRRMFRKYFTLKWMIPVHRGHGKVCLCEYGSLDRAIKYH